MRSYIGVIVHFISN